MVVLREVDARDRRFMIYTDERGGGQGHAQP